jgi:hypothetical protein
MLHRSTWGKEAHNGFWVQGSGGVKVQGTKAKSEESRKLESSRPKANSKRNLDRMNRIFLARLSRALYFYK